MKPTLWKVKFIQKDKPNHTFDAGYMSQEELDKGIALHSQFFDMEIETFLTIPLDKYKHGEQVVLPQVPKIFSVKHYCSDEHPSLRGMGYDVFVADDREHVEEFAETLNEALARIGQLAK